MSSSLSDRARRLRKRVQEREDALAQAKRGQKEKKRKLLNDARKDLRSVERQIEKQRSTARKEAEKLERKAAKLAEKARKARERLYSEIPIDTTQPEPKKRAPAKPFPKRKKPAPVLYSKQPDSNMYPGVYGVAGFLVEEWEDDGGQVYQYPDGSGFDAQWETSYVNQILPMADWIIREDVWYRAEISLGYRDQLLDSAGYPVGDKGDDGSLTRGEGSAEHTYYVTNGTNWHRAPADLDATIRSIVENIEAKYGTPDQTQVKIIAAGRENGLKPPSPRKPKR